MTRGATARVGIPVAVAAVVAAAGTAVLLAAPTASARPCPDGTRYQTVTTVAGRPVGTCLPYVQPCDPNPCEPPPTSPPPRP